MEPFNAERIEARVTADRALSVALREIGRLARVVEEQSARIESLEGANVKRDSESEPDAEPPYRMTEPQNLGASVTSDWTVFTRTDSSDTPWRQHDAIGLAPLRWDWITNPEPHRNCTLTADDPEPPGGSVVRCDDDSVWQSETGGDWRSMDDVNAYEWTRLLSDRHPVTLLYRGEA